MSKPWYVREVPSAEPIGPFSTAELRAEVKAGRFREALVATDGATEWRPLIAELAQEDQVGSAPTTAMPALTPTPRPGSAAPLPPPVPPPVPPRRPSSRPPPAPPQTLPLRASASRPPVYPPVDSAAPVPPYGAPPPRAPHAGPLPSFPPPPASVPPLPQAMGGAPRSGMSNAALLVLASVGALLVAVVAFTIVFLVRKGAAPGKDQSSGIVRVVLPKGSGTGFFVNGPDDLAYVATAYHVIASGEPILVEQTLEGAHGQRYPEAYPDVEVVAFDADADVAVIRLNGVSRDHFRALTLAASATADESVLSYGFPGSSLAHKFGMVSKPGKILSLVRFPVLDHRTGEVVRNDAIAGLLVSVDIEPGFSGGPTCNDRGEVVGVNVTKDLAHRGQNGAVDVSVLRDLLTHVKKASDAKDPTPDEVKELLTRVEREYLLLPLDKRKSAREDELVSSSDLPRVEELITTIRKLENDTSRKADGKISGAAALGLVLARLPGRPLETYTDRATRKAMAECEVREKGLREFFGPLATPKGGGQAPGAAEEARAKCSELAFRPLVWDLTALALQWEGQPRDITVSKVEVVDPDRHFYRVPVRFSGVDHLVDVWVGGDGGRLRLKLFDGAGEATGLSTARAVQASAFSGTWHRSDPRIAHNVSREVESDMDTDETLAVAVAGDGSATITHQFRRHLYMTGPRRLACGGSTLSLGLEQSFNGSLESGSITAARSKDARALGADMPRCGDALGYAPDLVVVLKIVGDKLLVYRTGGGEYPEVAEFTRE